jgi:uncharacterized membrane protein
MDIDPDNRRHWVRYRPYVFLAAGVGMLVSGWFMRSQSTIPGLINIVAGATFALYGACLALRQRKSK